MTFYRPSLVAWRNGVYNFIFRFLPNGARMTCDTPTPMRPSDCLAEEWLAFLGHRWNALVMWQMTQGAMRFCDLQTALPGISAKVLTERLNGLVERGLIVRVMTNSFPREVTYTLSGRGQSLRPVLVQLYQWAEADGRVFGS